jgi:(S)-2-hydroxyglutarate dehydrogenase
MALTKPKSRTCIIGGGLVGLATAYHVLLDRVGAEVVVLEKDRQTAAQQSTHNSGVLHAGLAYRAGSAKARLAVRGIRLMTEFCRTHGIAHEICGKVVVATTPEEVGRLDRLEVQGRQNGLVGLERLRSATAIREREPHAAGIEGLVVPEEGIVDYRGVADALGREIHRLGGRIVTDCRVEKIQRDRGRWRIIGAAADVAADVVVTCGGLHSDRLVTESGMRPVSRIVPFRGEYYELKPERRHLVRNLIYPVPDPKFPFLGVHFTRLISGGIEAGPNAVLAMHREGYRRGDFRFRDAAETLSYPGLWRFIARHGRMATYEWYRSWSRAEFCRSLQKLVPDMQAEDLVVGGAGVRAQAMNPDGMLVDDFQFVKGDRILHVVNAPSPAATASLAIGEHIHRELASFSE